MKTLRAGIYVRISNDPNDLREGVARQEKDCREVAQRKGWEVVEVYEDNDLSAWSGKARPRFLDMLRDIEDGQLDAVIIWHLDRLARGMRDLEDFIDACTKTGTKVATATGDLDVGTSDGLAMARIMTTIARKSSDDSSRRVQRKMEENARLGKPAGGGRRAYGYEQDGIDPKTGKPKPGYVGRVIASERDVILEAAERVEAGEGLIGIALDFNRRGIKTATGGTWGTRSVKRLLTERRWAGLSEYKGELLLDKEGNPIRGQWEAIIRSEDGDDPLARHDNLRRILLHKSRTNGGSTARKYLLPGYVYCETCGKRLVSRSRGKTGHRSYQCAVQSPYNGCGKLSVIAGPLEDMVRDAVFEALEGPNLEEAIRAAVGDDEEQASAMASLREDRARLEELATDFYANGLLSRSEFLAARKVIEERIGQTERRLSRSARSKVLASLPGDGAALRAAWDAKGLDWKRSVVGTVLDRVVISPATIRGKNRFDPRRVQFVWKL